MTDQIEEGSSPKTKRLTFEVSPDVWRQVKDQATANETTMGAIVLRALRAVGFSIPDADLDDKRK